jgi:hypothetical protein
VREVCGSGRRSPLEVRAEAVRYPAEESAGGVLDEREPVLTRLDRCVGVGNNGLGDKDAAARRKADEEVVIPADQMAPLVGVEGAERSNETHAVGLIGGICMGRRHRDGPQVDGNRSEGAARKGAAQVRVVLEQRLLGAVVIGVDGEAERLEDR